MIFSVTSFVHDFESELPTARAASAFAERQGACLDLYSIGVDMMDFGTVTATGAIIPGDGITAARSEATAIAKQLKDSISLDPNKLFVDSIATPQLTLDQNIARVARYTDLTIARQPHCTGASPLAAHIFEAALFAAHSPMLVLPDQQDEIPDFKRITIAWNESPEALDAIRRARPFLRKAEQVHVVMVNPPKTSAERSDPGGALCGWLARCGTRAEVSVINKSKPRVSEVLMEFTAERESDLLVMGAYGHSRFREALMGGATRELLTGAPCPVFMSH